VPINIVPINIDQTAVEPKMKNYEILWFHFYFRLLIGFRLRADPFHEVAHTIPFLKCQQLSYFNFYIRVIKCKPISVICP
jgi:hypothetical protein